MIEKIQIIHEDFQEALRVMPYESVGRVFMALIAFASDEDPDPILGDDLTAKVKFYDIKSQVIRNENYRISKSHAGSEGGKAKADKVKQNVAQLGTSKHDVAQLGTSKQGVAPSPSPYPIPNPNNEKTIVEVLKYLNDKAGTKYGQSKETVKLINARIRDGFTEEDFKKVIDKKVKEWKGTEQAMYIRPSTLFAPSHFEEYLNAPEKVPLKPLQHSQLHHMMKADYNIEELEKRLIKN